jgi:hypothetical protein
VTALHRQRQGGHPDERETALAYLGDAELIGRTVRGALIAGDPGFDNVPKLCLEMVRCTVLVDRVADPADGLLRELRDALLGELTRLERYSPADPRGDQSLARVARLWAAYRMVAVRALAGGEPAGDPGGNRMGRVQHSHPSAVLPYLRPQLPCPGLVAAAADAFAAEGLAAAPAPGHRPPPNGK